MNFPHQKVKAHQPPPDPTEQSTDRNGGGMSGKLKKKIIKIRRNRNRTKKADRQKQVESAERTMSMLELADENDVYVDTPHDRMNLNFPPPLPPPSAPNQSSIYAKQLKSISDQFHQLPSLNSSEKVAKRAAPLKQNCKKPLTNEDIRAINLWCELALKSIPKSPSFSFLQIAFQSGPYSGGTSFNVNRLVNKFPESPYLKTLREVSLKVLRNFRGGSERQSFKVLEVIRKIERNKAKHTQGKTDTSVTAFGVTDWSDPKNAAKLEKEYASVTSVDQRNWINSKIPEGARVLDYGCGPGYLLEMLSSDSVGVDTSVAMCEMSRKRNAAKQILHLQLQDGRDVCRELEAGSFDFVVVCQVLLYCEEPLETIRRLHGLLKPEGRLILVETDWNR
ncbi:hypothetical protein TL16_g09617 [Triparma laevis f. inornata]|uniref:Methyltransferase type 11 domain-containing protein n=1 Tax=Triparma laevis f. inornata TaxID=1714386 RepID=A0A9W7B992_9STRA|nr:hypothetical protein TL16_g09617 [Triparma laevis f. inornata]